MMVHLNRGMLHSHLKEWDGGARRPCGVSCKRVMAGLVRGAAGPWALDLLRALPRVSLANLRPNPGSRKLER